MNVRRLRRWLASLMILGFASAQFISLAHACMSGSSAAVGTSAEAGAGMPADCPGMAHNAASDAACDAHCVPHGQATNSVDGRIPALAPPSVLVVRIVRPAAVNMVRAAPLQTRIASPPSALLSTRLLI
jgi:hypothetical protein